MGRTLATRPKRLFHAIVACGVTITACGTSSGPGDGDASSDASLDAHKKPDADASLFASDAQDEPDAFDPPDVVDDTVVVIKPPLPIS